MDGTRLAYRSDAEDCIRVKDLATGAEEKHCDNTLDNLPAHLSPDGTRIAYSAGRRARVMDAGGGKDVVLCRGCRAAAWFADNRRLLVLYGSRRVSMVEVTERPGEGELREVLRGEEHAIAEPRPSPDGLWIAFHQTGPGKPRVFVAPLHEKERAHAKEWIPVTAGEYDGRSARWSPDGNLLYFLSDRDGFRCVWAQRLAARTKRARGAAFGVQHFHHARLSLMGVADPEEIGLSIANNRLVLAIPERTGNIWMLRAEP
jgi:Tol biopolymer transport system component